MAKDYLIWFMTDHKTQMVLSAQSFSVDAARRPWYLVVSEMRLSGSTR